jgi:hypothetical protein
MTTDVFRVGDTVATRVGWRGEVIAIEEPDVHGNCLRVRWLTGCEEGDECLCHPDLLDRLPRVEEPAS